MGYPEVVFTGVPNAAAKLLADLPAAQAATREAGLPDPDVATLQITLEVRALGLDDGPGGGTDGGFQPVYATTRPFPNDPTVPLTLALTWTDVHNVNTLSPAPTTGAIPVPTSRDVRLVFAAIGRADPTLAYFGASDVLVGTTASVLVRHESTDETGLFLPAEPSQLLQAIYLQPTALLDAATASAALTAGLGVQAPGNPIGRLAAELQLNVNGLVLRGRLGRRTVFGASGNCGTSWLPTIRALPSLPIRTSRCIGLLRCVYPSTATGRGAGCLHPELPLSVMEPSWAKSSLALRPITTRSSTPIARSLISCFSTSSNPNQT